MLGVTDCKRPARTIACAHLLAKGGNAAASTTTITHGRNASWRHLRFSSAARLGTWLCVTAVRRCGARGHAGSWPQQTFQSAWARHSPSSGCHMAGGAQDMASKASGTRSHHSPTDAAHALDVVGFVVALAVAIGRLSASGMAQGWPVVALSAAAQRLGIGRPAQRRRHQCSHAVSPARRHGRRRRERFFRLYRGFRRHAVALAEPAVAGADTTLPASAWWRRRVRRLRGHVAGRHRRKPAVSRWQTPVLPAAPGRLRHRGAGIPSAAATAAQAQEHRLDLRRKPGAHLLRRTGVSRPDAQFARGCDRSGGRAQSRLHRRQRLDHRRHGRLDVRRAAHHRAGR